MRELTRSNDPVFVSWLRASLADQGIDSVLLDGFSSGMMQPLNASAGQRVMVGNDDYWPAWTVLAEAEERVAEDTVLGGRVRLLQPKEGFRAAIDPVLLAAAVPAVTGDFVLELGAGSGAAALCLAARVDHCHVDGVDVQPDLAALANRSAQLGAVEGRVRFFAGDVLTLPPAVAKRAYDHVMANPPYLPATAAQMPADPARALAVVEGDAALADWIDAALSVLREGGTLTLIHRADRVSEIEALLSGRAGLVGVLELLTKDDGRPAKRALVQARKGAAAEPVRRTMLLHDETGAFTAEADAALRDAAPVAIS